MLDKGFIDQRQHDAAMTEPLRLAPAIEPQGQLAPEVVELVKRTLKEVVGEAHQERRLHRHDDHRSQLQAAARKAVRDNLDAYDKRYKLLGPFAPPSASARQEEAASRPRSPSRGRPVRRAQGARSAQVIGSRRRAGIARHARGDRDREP